MTMQAVRIHPSEDQDKPYSATNPASSSALFLDTIDIPQPQGPDEIVVKVHATTVIRDTLTWPEMYSHPFAIPGHDFAGTVASVHPDAADGRNVQTTHSFAIGDQVYGMVDAGRGQCWAEYVVVKAREATVKPTTLSWDESATVPLSALTAWQALFDKGGVPLPSSLRGDRDTGSNADTESEQRTVLITGASGGVGVWLVQLAKMAGCYVVAGTTARTRSEKALKDLGADEVIEYTELKDSKSASRYDTIIDCVAGAVLETCWAAVKDQGTLVSIHSDSFEFVREHRESGIARGKDDVDALFFIVEASGDDLAILTKLIDRGQSKTFVAGSYPLADVRKVYDLCHSDSGPRGKLVLVP